MRKSTRKCLSLRYFEYFKEWGDFTLRVTLDSRMIIWEVSYLISEIETIRLKFILSKIKSQLSISLALTPIISHEIRLKFQCNSSAFHFFYDFGLLSKLIVVIRSLVLKFLQFFESFFFFIFYFLFFFVCA